MRKKGIGGGIQAEYTKSKEKKKKGDEEKGRRGGGVVTRGLVKQTIEV